MALSSLVEAHRFDRMDPLTGLHADYPVDKQQRSGEAGLRMPAMSRDFASLMPAPARLTARTGCVWWLPAARLARA